MTWQTFLTAFGAGLVALLGGGTILVLMQRYWLEEEREALADAVRQIRAARPSPSLDERKDRPSTHLPTPDSSIRPPYPYHNWGQPTASDHHSVYGGSTYRGPASSWNPYD